MSQVQATRLSIAPITVALSRIERPGCTAVLPGMIETETPGGPVTVTTAVSALPGSATLVATTWKVPDATGAVYVPAGSIEPPAGPSLIAQDTRVSREPVTSAENHWVSPCRRLTVPGETRTETAARETTAVAEAADSARLVALT